MPTGPFSPSRTVSPSTPPAQGMCATHSPIAKVPLADVHALDTWALALQVRIVVWQALLAHSARHALAGCAEPCMAPQFIIACHPAMGHLITHASSISRH